MEELASPFHTYWVLLSGCVLVALLIVLRIGLEQSKMDTWVLVNHFAAYHLATQLVYWGTAAYLGEFYRLCLKNVWRWIDLAAGCYAIGTAYVISVDVTEVRAIMGPLADYVPAEQDALVATLGAWATGLLWLSLLGYLAQWCWCGMAIFVGSAVQLVSTLFWPFMAAAMGIVAMSQILYTLEDCADARYSLEHTDPLRTASLRVSIVRLTR